MPPILAILVLAAAQMQAVAGDGAPVGADQVSSPATVAATMADQVGGPGARQDLVSAPSSPSRDVAHTNRRLGATEQAGPRARGIGAPVQITAAGRTATAPPALSTRGEGRVVSIVTVHGHDRCDPVKGEATREECAAILDYRADQFAKPHTPELTPEDALLESPSSTNLTADATAARRLGGPEGADPSVAAAAAAVEGSPEGAQAAAIAATDHVAPAVPAGTFPTVPAPAGGGGPTVTVTGPR